MSAVKTFPKTSGKDVVLAGIIRFWSDLVGPENVTFVMVRPASEPDITSFPVQLRQLRTRGARRSMISVATRTLTGRSSLQESVLFDPALGHQIAECIEESDADVVIFDTVRLGQYVGYLPENPAQRRYVYMDDLFSIRYQGMLDAAKQFDDVDIDALGQFRSFIPGSLHGLVTSRPVQRTLLSLERRLIAKAEQNAVRQFDRCFLINDMEARQLSAQTGATNVAAMPPLIPTPRVTARSYQGRPDFLFLGHLEIPHNDDAVRWFLESAMDELLRIEPRARLRIVGREPRPALVRSAQRFGDRVVLEGYVDNLDGLMNECAALVTPLRFGSGIKIKLMDALARGLPSVSTTVGAHGVVTDNRSGVLVEDDITAYPALLQRLTDPAYNDVVSRQARGHYDRTFHEDAVTEAYRRAFEIPGIEVQPYRVRQLRAG
ncbi:MAG: glycosyltransferase family 4 protein [Dermatophilaceae bacterium]